MPMGRKQRVLISLAAAIGVLAVAAYYALSRFDYGEDLLFSRVQSALAASGFAISAENLRGNPITGVFGSSVGITAGTEAVVSADEIEMKLSLRSLLSGSPKLSRMTFRGLRADAEAVARNLPTGKAGGGGAPALNSLHLQDAVIMTRWGAFNLSRAVVTLRSDRYGVSVRGEFHERPLILRGLLEVADGVNILKGANVEWGATRLEASGRLSPDGALSLEFAELDVDAVGKAFPSLAGSTVHGVFSGRANVALAPELAVSGDASAPDGRVWRFPYESLKMNFTYADNRIRVDVKDGRIFGAPTRGEALIDVYAGRSPSLRLRFDVNDLETNEMTKEFEFLKQLPGKVDFVSCDISGPVQALNGTVNLRGASVHTADFALRDITARATLRDTSTISAEFAATIWESRIKGDAGIALSEPYPMNVTLLLPQLELSALAKSYPELAKLGLSGTARVEAEITGNPSDLRAAATISMPRLERENVSLSDLRADVVYAGGEVSLTDGRALWNGSEITASGKYLTRSKNLDFTGRFSKLDLASLDGMVPAIAANDIAGIVAGKWSVAGSASNPEVGFEVESPRVAAAKYAAFTDVRASGAYLSPDIDLSEVSARFGKGGITGGGSLSLAGSAVSYDIAGRFERIDVADLPIDGLISSDLGGSLNGTARLWGSGGRTPRVSVRFANSNIHAAKGDVLDLSGVVELDEGDIAFKDILACFYSGNLSLDGRLRGVVGGSGRTGGIPLEISAELRSVDIGRVARIFAPSSRGYQGLIVASADIRGTTKAPVFTAGGHLLGTRAFGLFFPRIRFSGVSGDAKHVAFPRVDAFVGRGVINASAELANDNGWHGAVSAVGRSVDVRSLTASLGDDMRRGISGALDFDFKGEGSLASFQGTGTVNVPTLSAMGVKLTDVRAPFMISDGFVMVEDSSASAYGGTVMMQVAKDLKMSRWGGRVEIRSADMAQVFPSVLPDIGGTVTGIANFDMRFGGDSRRTSLQDAEGSLEINDGEIVGFKGAAAVSKMIGGRPLRFKSAIASFNIDGKTFYLLPGSRVAAPKGDPIFKYVMVDGSIPLEGAMNLSCVGNVNIRALNVFAGALQGLMSAGAAGFDSTETALQNFLGGAITGFSRNEFRDVSLRVIGEPDSIHFTDVKVAAPVKVDLKPEALSDLDNTKEKDQERIRINLEFPVGPGSSGRGNGATEQVGGQVLEQALKELLTF